MEVQEAIRQAQAHLKNALDLVPRPVGKEELLFMWDNQITALDNFLAETEALADEVLAKVRAEVLDAKKKLMTAVMKFEAQAEGVEFQEEQLAPEDAVVMYTEMANDLLSLAKEALDEKVKGIQELVKWEEPLSILNGYLADSESFQILSKDLRRARSAVRTARRELRGRVDEVFAAWKQADRKSGASDDDEDD